MGTSAARVDTVAPNVGLDISGTSGANGWYVSPITVTATGSDATSGVASTLLSIDGGATWQPALILNEGVYNAVVTVADNAGNVSSSAATLSVDTTTPSINMSVSGTLGKNGWYKSAIQVSALASDTTSGVASFEVSADGAAYQTYTPIAFNDGPHTIQFKAVDAAGNVTETAPQTFYVDTLAPTVNLPASWKLGTNVPYDVLDEGSGLGALRIVIEDEDEKYAKVAWDQEVSGSMYSQDIDWNGEFKDKTVAPPGTYLVWIKASDLAGNERFQLGKVIVPETNLFLSLLPTEEPAASASPVPPAELFEPEAAPSVTTPPTTGFGGETTQPGEATTQSLLLATGSAGAAGATTSGVLWGAAAAAAISAASAYAFEATRKRKEAESAQDEEKRAKKHLTRSEKVERAREHDEKVKERKERQAWANPAKEKELLRQQKERDQAYQEWLQQQQAQAQAAANARMAEKMTKFEKQEETAWVAAQAAIKAKQEEKKKTEEAAAKQAAQLQATTGYFNSEKQAQASVVTAPQEKSWWQKAWEGIKNTTDKAIQWVDQHQAEIALVVGVAVGIGAILLSGGAATPLVAAAWIAGAAVVAGGTVALGTVALNAHFDRPLATNVWQNVKIASTAAAVTTGVGLALGSGAVQQVLYRGGNAIVSTCVKHPVGCGRVAAGIQLWDKVEDLGLQAKLLIQTAAGNPAAADTALELQLEHLDNTPGNTTFREIYDNVVELIGKHGDEATQIATTVARLGRDTQIGDDGLIKVGTDATADAIEEVTEELRAIPGRKVWTSGDKIYVNAPTQEALEAMARLKTAVNSGADDATINRLIDEVALASSRGSGDRVVLGAWKEGSGYIGEAVENSGIFYDTGDEVWKLLEKSGVDPWRANEAFLRNQLESGVDRIDFVGENVNDLLAKYSKDPRPPYRVKEILWLEKNAADYGYTKVGNSWIKTTP